MQQNSAEDLKQLVNSNLTQNIDIELLIDHMHLAPFNKNEWFWVITVVNGLVHVEVTYKQG